MYARISCYEPTGNQDQQYHWKLELAHTREFSGHVVAGLFPTLREILDIIEANEHFIID